MTLVAVFSVVAGASAQTGETLPRGARVRITPATPTPVIVGRLLAVSDSTLLVRRQRGKGDITIPRSAIQRLELSTGTRRGVNAGWGALIGLGVGGVVGYYSVGENPWWFDRRGAAVFGGATGAAAGSLLGLVVGSFERWRDTAMPM